MLRMCDTIDTDGAAVLSSRPGLSMGERVLFAIDGAKDGTNVGTAVEGVAVVGDADGAIEIVGEAVSVGAEDGV